MYGIVVGAACATVFNGFLQITKAFRYGQRDVELGWSALFAGTSGIAAYALRNNQFCREAFGTFAAVTVVWETTDQIIAARNRTRR